MFRTVVGSFLALIGAAGAVWSPFRAWYDGRHGSDIRVDDLFTGVGVTPDKAALLGSLFLVMGFAALLTLLGVLLRSRAALALAALLVLGITILWMVRQGQAAGSLTAGGNGLDYGVATAFAGGLLILLSAFVLPGRRGGRSRVYGEPVREHPRDEEPRDEEPRYDESRYDESRYGEVRYDEPPYEEPRYEEPRYEEPPMPEYEPETEPARPATEDKAGPPGR